MARRNLNDLLAFVTVAREGSFTRAAAALGVTQSALSQTVRALEERLQIRLLTRTTRSVSPTAAGERLMQAIGHRFDEIEAELALLSERRDKPAGNIRISAGEHAALTVLQPAIARLLPNYPDIHIEVVVDNGMTDIVATRCDAGVRLGEQVAKDMIAMPIGPDFRMAVVASPAYFSRTPPPVTPQDLMAHNCINMRLPTLGGLYAWEFAKDGQELKVRVEGQMIYNNMGMRLQSALDGLGLACMAEDVVLPYVADGRLIRVLDDWCPAYAGYKLYYPSRRHPSPAFTLLLDTLRYRGV
ncbi:MAG: LysR family transcriptional regulator [Janthinobacterium sp.]